MLTPIPEEKEYPEVIGIKKVSFHENVEEYSTSEISIIHVHPDEFNVVNYHEGVNAETLRVHDLRKTDFHLKSPDEQKKYLDQIIDIETDSISKKTKKTQLIDSPKKISIKDDSQKIVIIYPKAIKLKEKIDHQTTLTSVPKKTTTEKHRLPNDHKTRKLSKIKNEKINYDKLILVIHGIVLAGMFVEAVFSPIREIINFLRKKRTAVPVTKPTEAQPQKTQELSKFTQKQNKRNDSNLKPHKSNTVTTQKTGTTQKIK